PINAPLLRLRTQLLSKEERVLEHKPTTRNVERWCSALQVGGLWQSLSWAYPWGGQRRSVVPHPGNRAENV
ncbi:jg824, partial [Pararge aegeria aegeria]